jgi:hypothetical protein
MWLPEALIYSHFRPTTRYEALSYCSFFNYLKKIRASHAETFAARPIAGEVKNNINHPCNAFHAQADARDIFDRLA